MQPRRLGVQIVQRLRCVLAGDDVLTLGATQILPVGCRRPVQGIAAEQHARAALIIEVSEYHELNGHRRAQIFRNAVMLAVAAGTPRVPGIEHGPDGSVQLQHGIAGNGLARMALDPRPPGSEPFIALEFRAIRSQHHFGVELKEAAVRIPSESRIARFCGQRWQVRFADAEIEQRIHHARHRNRSA